MRSRLSIAPEASLQLLEPSEKLLPLLFPVPPLRGELFKESGQSMIVHDF